ncbi:hypothetical protein ACIQU2_27470 [Pseudomonas sp. NPDC098740]|uniref:hypothetical protein n=1 Tax=Pseudomonas sp. NPDC098740 TaxID=3364486 RepID=UPI00383BC2AF
MNARPFPVGLSEMVIGRKIEQRFGLLGLGRLLKLVELVVVRADRSTTAPGLSAVMAWGDFLAALSCNQEDAGEFLSYCDHARVLDRGDEGGRLRLTLVGELVARLIPPDAPAQAVGERLLFNTDKQWVEWFKSDLNCPPYLLNDSATRQLFRRWCVTNVTVDEVEAATERAIKAGEAPHPAVLHDHLKALRLDKLRALA